ncbi:TonB-dependent receptor plug domain-containing protein [Rubricoccus marinus]|uniref:TonB-dependent receptor plug domain-containing protein n=1 Tax=Rubricoccus marinus TaxID=716817 RepID=A0A259TV79_9BACT|nr:TonB-dependent receptor [Rubricoccus marinus]OZC01527.1 hypothetical protein BSZ36_00115 [Rubricoccus marinus]
MHRFAALLLLLASGVTASGALSPARAQEVREDSLAAISVSAARVPLPTPEAPARATVLSAESAQEAGATTLAEWLEARAPLHVRRYGPAGLATITVRGASASQTLVLLDGQPLADPQLGQLDLSLLPTALLGGAEVLHGGGAHLYGSGAVGGVVSLRSPEARSPLALTTSAGAWGRRTLGATAHASHLTRVGRWRAMAAAETEGADDDYGIVDPSRLDGRVDRRAGWDRQRRAGVARLSLEGARGAASVTAWGVDAERGLGGTDSVGARQWDRMGRLAVAASTRRGPLALGTSAAFQSGLLRYASPFDLGTAQATGAAPIDDTGRTRVASGDLRADFDARTWTLSAVASGARGTADHPSLASGATDDRLGFALSAASARGRLRLYPALRLDHHVPAGGETQTALSPRLGANLRLARGFHLKSSAGTAFRMPTLNDRFWRPGGNPDLLPERSASGDLGLAWASGTSGAELTVFAASTRDQIVWRPLAGGVWSPVNLTRTRAIGLEASGRVARTARLFSRDALLDLGAVGTLTDARDRSTPGARSFGQQLRLVPRWTASAWGGLEVARLARGGLLRRTTLRLDLGVQAVGRRSTTDSGSLALPAHAVVRGQVRLWREIAGSRLALGLAAENLLGARYEVVPTYVMPPRHLRGSLTLTL